MARRYGPALVTPSMLPPANTPEDELPNGLPAAAEYLGGRGDEVIRALAGVVETSTPLGKRPSGGIVGGPAG